MNDSIILETIKKKLNASSKKNDFSVLHFLINEKEMDRKWVAFGDYYIL